MARTASKGSRATIDIGGLREELEALATQVTRLAEKSTAEGGGLIAEEIGRLKGTLEALVGRAGDRADEIRERAIEFGQDSIDEMAACVARRPLTSVATAFAIGVVFALILGRRS
jgi:ElaB/YqjD/DUF883 family membrane-anchored ribosome-binding protein